MIWVINSDAMLCDEPALLRDGPLITHHGLWVRGGSIRFVVVGWFRGWCERREEGGRRRGGGVPRRMWTHKYLSPCVRCASVIMGLRSATLSPAKRARLLVTRCTQAHSNLTTTTIPRQISPPDMPLVTFLGV